MGINYSFMANFNGSLTAIEVSHEWVINFHIAQLNWILIHALFPVNHLSKSVSKKGALGVS